MVSDDVIAVTRHCPASHKSIVMVAHTAFSAPHHDATPTHSNRHPNHCYIPPMSVPGEVDHMILWLTLIVGNPLVGVIDEVIFEAKLVRDDTAPDEFVKREDVIGGLHGYHLDIQTHVPLDQSKQCQLIASGDSQEVAFDGFSVGSVIVLRCVVRIYVMWVCLCVVDGSKVS